MHERTQRAIARLMFVFCCAVPTALTMLCVLVTWTPWYHNRTLRGIEAGLCKDTGLIVQIEDFHRPSPSTLQLHGVRVMEPETGREVARVRELMWVWRGDEVSIRVHQPELQSSELANAWKLIHDRFLCRPEYTSLPVQIAGNDLTIHSRTGALTLRDVDAWIRPSENAIDMTVQCLPAISRSDSPFSITVRRDRSGALPSTQTLLDTGGAALPCSALAEYLPGLESLGRDAMFSGTMRWQLQADDQWWIDLGGSQFDNVALDRLFERQVHRLSGTARIQLTRCRVEPFNRRSDIVGSIRAKDGMVSRSLLVSAHKHLGFEVKIPQSMIDADGDVPYDLMAIGFEINKTQLELDGICRTETGYHSIPPGVVLCLDLQPLVGSSDKTLDSLKLIATIAPSHSVPVPLSNQTSWLTKVFIPPSRPLPRDEAYPPRIRAAENWRGGPTISQPGPR